MTPADLTLRQRRRVCDAIRRAAQRDLGPLFDVEAFCSPEHGVGFRYRVDGFRCHLRGLVRVSDFGGIVWKCTGPGGVVRGVGGTYDHALENFADAWSDYRGDGADERVMRDRRLALELAAIVER